ncbi:MAG: SDR family oxidoreductase [Myxococcales bacterium]|nr:SDR family oxidoreductase [Myxococcales bacterium]
MTTVRADLERERLGLGAAAYDALAARTGAVIHGAASVSFTAPLDYFAKLFRSCVDSDWGKREPA